MSRPDPDSAFDPAPYADRRRRLLAHMRARGGGAAVLATAPVALRNRDAAYPYRHDSDFHYLTGFAEPEAWVVLVAGREDRTILFCRPRSEQDEIWEGLRCGPEAAAGRYGFDEAWPVDELDARLPELLAGLPAVYAPLGTDPAAARLHGWLARARELARGARPVPSAWHDLRAVTAGMRLVKDASEQDVMRRAADIAAAAHLRAMRAARPGLREYEIEAELLYEFRRRGAQAPAYESIVAAGANACILHYPAGDAVLRDGELLLIDAGCELDGYASDITRTFPVGGRYSGPQRALYDLVLAAQEAAVAATAPGRGCDDGHDAAVRVLAQGMLDEGLLSGSLDGVLESGAYRRFYMHRTGHWLGRDVHDVGSYREEAGATPDGSGSRDAGSHSGSNSGGNGNDAGDGKAGGAGLPWRRLVPGMVLTIEPGIYVRAADDVPERFHGIGIRIEDDALVTETGCELISRGVPVRAEDIEAVMREAKAAGREAG